jgi:hypothetical protein
MTKSLEAENYAAHRAGARLSGEPSHAREARYYRGPANVVEFPAEIERQRKLKEVRKLKQVQCRKGK